MVLSIGFIMGFIGAAIALIIGILIFSEIESAIDCESIGDYNPTAQRQCQSAKDTAWIVIGILPIALFFAMFSIFGGMMGRDDEDEPVSKYDIMQNSLHSSRMSVDQKRKLMKKKQQESDDKMFGTVDSHRDVLQHSFLSKWLRKKKQL